MAYPSQADYLRPQPTRSEVLAALAPYAAPSNAGIAVFLFEATALWVCIAGVLYLPEWWMRLGTSLVAGIIWFNFMSMGHDAVHGSMAKGPRWNKFIAFYTLTHCAFHVRVWRWEHHKRHHGMTSSYGTDAWQPLSLAQYRAASPARRFMERLYRAPTFFNFAAHLASLRLPALRAYWRSVDDAERTLAKRYFWAQGGTLLVYWVFLFCAPLYSPRGSFEAWALGFLLPYFIFMAMFGGAAYLQHTHEALPWYQTPSMEGPLQRDDLLAATQRFPYLFSLIAHHLQFHAPHHTHPRIPCWRLKPAFETMHKMLGPVLIYDDRNLLRHTISTLRRCKLYDYERHQWLDFDGNPTCPPSPLALANASLRTQTPEPATA